MDEAFQNELQTLEELYFEKGVQGYENVLERLVEIAESLTPEEQIGEKGILVCAVIAIIHAHGMHDLDLGRATQRSKKEQETLLKFLELTFRNDLKKSLEPKPNKSPM